MLRILTARAGGGQLDTILKRMGEWDGPGVLIVPEQYSHETERAVCRVLPPARSARCEVLSFTRLARRVAEAVGGVADPMLDGGGRVLLMQAAVKQTAEHLTVYRTPSRRPSFLAGLAATVDECKSYGVTPQRLAEAAEELPGSEGAKLRDIALIYGAYNALTARSAADPKDRLDRLAEGLAKCDWAASRRFWVWGFTDFSAQEGAVLRALMEKGQELTVALTLDGTAPDPADIFGAAKRTAAYLRRLAESAGAEVTVERLSSVSRRVSALDHLERNLFAVSPQPWTGEDGVCVISAPDPRTEVEWAAAEILRLCREEGLHYRQIALCARNFDRYAPLVESVFARYGVSVFFSAVTDVLQKPVLALVTAVLDCVSGGYAAEDVLRCLKTGLTGLSDEERDLLENYALTWEIRGSKWTAEKPWTMHPEGYGRDWTDAHRALVERLDGLRRRLTAPMETLRRCGGHTGRDWAVALYRCLEEMELPERLEQYADRLDGRGDLQRGAECRQLWDILCGGLEQCALLLADTALELEEFAHLFKLVLSQYDVSAIPASLDRVTAGDCTRMAGKEAEILFLLGADSASIPAVSPAPGLLSDHDRGLLAEREITLAPRTEDKLRREMTIVYETCAVPTRRLYVSWPAAEGDEERAPAFLVERLRAIFPHLREENAARLPLCAPRPALERVGSDPAAAAALRALPQWRQAAERVEKAASWRRGRLSRVGTQALYGAVIPLSATKLDQIASCHFSHFMRYGLDAKPRTKARFAPTDYGTFVHFVLETVLRRAMETENGLDRLAEDEGLRRAEADRAADLYVEDALRGVEESGRFRTLFGRMCRAVDHVVDNVVDELHRSDFRPAAFELGFGRKGGLPPVTAENGVTVRLSGLVDRVDCWNHDGKCYLRVVDYKTGKKAFDYTDLENGMGLQMLLYLFALEQEGAERFGGEIVPAGVLYLPARDPVVDGKRSLTADEVRAKADKELVRKGLVLDDPQVIAAMEHTEGGNRYLPIGGRTDSTVSRERMDRLAKLVRDKLEQAAGQLAEGNVDADPYWRGEEQNACRWCDYAAACHFEPACGDRLRRQRALSAKEFWARLEQEGEEEKTDGISAD